MKTILTIITLIAAYFGATELVSAQFGEFGLAGDVFGEGTWWKVTLYVVAMSHLTITAMSLSFHRYHTHKGVVFNKILDTLMQTWLWLVTSMSKLDWVSVHMYHHRFSDRPEDPHSPVQKGLAHALFLGVFDYTKAKNSEPVLKIRNNIKRNKYEQYISEHLMMGPMLLTVFNLCMFGTYWGSILSVINFMISPVFAVGGVNALAHTYGYQNHRSGDNSRNLGFLFPLNFIICGELDHNNHHARQKSCSFRHRWFEFDIGYAYIIVLSKLKLAQIKNAYTTVNLKVELSKQIKTLIESDFDFKNRFEEFCSEYKLNYAEMMQKVEDYIHGKKVELEKPMKDFIAEVRKTWYANMKLQLNY